MGDNVCKTKPTVMREICIIKSFIVLPSFSKFCPVILHLFKVQFCKKNLAFDKQKYKDLFDKVILSSIIKNSQNIT